MAIGLLLVYVIITTVYNWLQQQFTKLQTSDVHSKYHSITIYQNNVTHYLGNL